MTLEHNSIRRSVKERILSHRMTLVDWKALIVQQHSSIPPVKMQIPNELLVVGKQWTKKWFIERAKLTHVSLCLYPAILKRRDGIV